MIALERRNSVNCKEVIELVDAYLDGELDPVTNQGYRRAPAKMLASAISYLRNITRWSVRLARSLLITRLQQVCVNGFNPRYEIRFPQSAPGAAPGLSPTSPESNEMSGHVLFEMPWNWLGLAAALAVAVLIVWNLAPGLRRPGAEQFLATQLVASHVRSLMVDHLTDVASSDQHTVKPWFDGKLDFAPSVVNPASDGFPLVGGRLDYLNNRPVAALVYQRRKHFINVFIWPVETGDARATKAIRRQGYQLLHWVDRDLNYWAVSDASEQRVGGA